MRVLLDGRDYITSLLETAESNVLKQSALKNLGSTRGEDLSRHPFEVRVSYGTKIQHLQL